MTASMGDTGTEGYQPTLHHRPVSDRVSRITRFKQYLLLCSLFILPIKLRVRALYAMDSTHNLFAEQSLFHNLGYWKDHPATLDKACQAMAMLVGEAAAFGSQDTILDVGFGFGDQDLFWMEHFSPKRIVGLDIIPSHVTLARRRLGEHQLEDRIELRLGSATQLPFKPGSFDKVVALESAFHFITREKFFHEAYRVLRPGGRIATAEPIPMAGNKQSWLAEYLQRSIVATPKENLYPRETYEKKLEQVGFQHIRVVSIREHVYAPFMCYLSQRISDPEVVQRVNPLVRELWRGWIDSFESGNAARGAEGQDYILAVADKPGA
jgi:erythromycin 3''-O-methyltransferase